MFEPSVYRRIGIAIGLVEGRLPSRSSLLNSVRRPDFRRADADPFGAVVGVAGDADLGVRIVGDTEPSFCSNVLLSTAIEWSAEQIRAIRAPSAPL
jgi:hypothetical protein